MNDPKVKVKWVASRNRLERDCVTPSLGVSIGPTPKVKFRGEFVLCDGRRCKGKRCSFPHSVEERDAWNAEKFESKCTRPS